jgi:hypothetical protein
VTAADCKTEYAAAGSRSACGSCGGDVTLPVTVADSEIGSEATGGGDVMFREIAADCKTGSAAAGGGLRGDILGKTTDGPVVATTPSAGRAPFTCSSKPAINAVSRSSRARLLPTSRCCT